MRKPVKALYIILMYTVLLVVGTGASNELQNTIAYDNVDLLSSILNESIGQSLEARYTQIESPLYFVPENQLASIWNGGTEIEYHTPSLPYNIVVYDYSTAQPIEYTELTPCTEQTDPLLSLCSTVCEPGAEHPLLYYILNEPVQEYTEPNALINYHQPTNTKRPKQAKKKNIPRKKQKKTEENIASSSGINSTENNELDNNKIKQIKRNISVWNNSRLKNRHRERQHLSYKPAVAFDKFRHNKYKEIGDEIHQSLIETYVKNCKAVYSEIPVQNEFWFAIACRTSRMHTKLADCRAMNENSSDYKFVEGLSGYYPGLPGDIVGYMNKHGPIASDQESIKTEWTETLGDIHVREPAESEYGISKETITFDICNEYRPLHTAVQMILALSEVYKDLSNITVEFIERTFREDTYLNHLEVVKALHVIVENQKSPNEPEIDRKYAVLYNVFTNILQQEYVSYEFIVINLYTEMYKSLVYFYEKAEACEKILENKRKNKNDKKEYYLLTGKCIIKPQRYLKCTTTINLNNPVSEYIHEMDDKETNEWSISSDIEKHYHIHYVDNTKQKYTRVCMSMYSDQQIHTISQTIEYLKRLYDIEEECICPYKRDLLGYWKYIQEEERNKTVQGFAECDIVFYYIEEGLRENYFTFAEFESYMQPKGETVRIPLFLSPLMRSAANMGPFEAADKIMYSVVDSMQSKCLWPSMYTYNPKYTIKEYSHMHYYYSNLYIRRDNADVPTIDCYIMGSKETIDNDIVTIEWYAKVLNSVDEYTHCLLSDKLMNDQNKYNAFSKAVTSQEYMPDCTLYGFGLQYTLEKINGFDAVGYNTDYPIDPNNIFDCKLGIVPIHKTSTNPKMADIQSKIDKLNRKQIRVNKKIKKLGTTEKQKNKLKKKRKSIYIMKYNKNKKLKQIQLLTKEEPNVTPLPSCAFFIVFRHSNTQTKSSLGAHNEILDAFTRRYNNQN